MIPTGNVTGQSYEIQTSVLHMDIYQLGILLAFALGAFLLGSVPAAFLIARAWGINILEVGTRNPGAANVFRSVNPFAGVLVLLADAGKGCLVVLIANTLDETRAIAPIAGAAVIAGHWFPVFLKFQGGAGLATAIGAGIGLSPLPGIIAAAIGLSVLVLIRNTGYAAGAGYTAFIFVSILMGYSWLVTLWSTLFGLAVLLNHFTIEVFRNRGG